MSRKSLKKNEAHAHLPAPPFSGMETISKCLRRELSLRKPFKSIEAKIFILSKDKGSLLTCRKTIFKAKKLSTHINLVWHLVCKRIQFQPNFFFPQDNKCLLLWMVWVAIISSKVVWYECDAVMKLNDLQYYSIYLKQHCYPLIK